MSEAVSSLQDIKPKFYERLKSPMRATYPTHLILLDLMTLIIFGEQHRLSGSQYGVSSSLVCLFLSWSQIFVLAPRSQTPIIPPSSLRAGGQVSHTHTNKGNMVLYILILTFESRRRDDTPPPTKEHNETNNFDT